jgi:MauM/NapG family ferredoxin protein
MKIKTVYKGLSRKNFLLATITVVAVFLINKMGFFIKLEKPKFSFLRPPGTTHEQNFLDRCIRCRACANVCEAGCIEFFSLTDSIEIAGTPYVNSRLRACNLCMNCTQICPTGALEPIERELDDIKSEVRMGTAYVVEEHCFSFNGKICGVCKDACPVNAITLDRAKPTVIPSICIGCGRCEERCPQTPTAIFVERKDLKHA